MLCNALGSYVAMCCVALCEVAQWLTERSIFFFSFCTWPNIEPHILVSDYRNKPLLRRHITDLIEVKTVHRNVNNTINQHADTYPVLDQLLPALYDGDPLEVARSPAVDGRVHTDSHVLKLVPVKYRYTKGREPVIKK